MIMQSADWRDIWHGNGEDSPTWQMAIHTNLPDLNWWHPNHHPRTHQHTSRLTDNVSFMSIFDNPFVFKGSYATSGLPLVYSTNNASVLKVNSSGLLEPVASGNVTVTVSQPEILTSRCRISNSGDENLGTRPQTITFADIGDQQLGQSVDLNASASSGLPVSFSIITGSSIASISGSTVSFSGTGPVTIQASQDGNSTYAAAASVSKSFGVKRPLAFTFSISGPKGANDVFKLNAIVLMG